MTNIASAFASAYRCLVSAEPELRLLFNFPIVLLSKCDFDPKVIWCTYNFSPWKHINFKFDVSSRFLVYFRLPSFGYDHFPHILISSISYFHHYVNESVVFSPCMRVRWIGVGFFELTATISLFIRYLLFLRFSICTRFSFSYLRELKHRNASSINALG